MRFDDSLDPMQAAAEASAFSTSEGPLLSILVPLYNEAEFIQAVLKRIVLRLFPRDSGAKSLSPTTPPPMAPRIWWKRLPRDIPG